jgi:hypothetical protein
MRLQLTDEGRKVRKTLVKAALWITGVLVVLRGCVGACRDMTTSLRTPTIPQQGAPPPLVQPAFSVPAPFPTSAMQRPQATPAPTPAVPISPGAVSQLQDLPLLVEVKADHAVAHVGDVITWTTRPSGGKGLYSYMWSGTDGVKGTGPVLMTIYDKPGPKTAIVTVYCDIELTKGAQYVRIEAAPAHAQ